MNSYSSKLLLNEPPMQLLPTLAARIGLEPAIVLQQIHYWLCVHEQAKSERHLRNGRYWVYNTCSKWQAQFRWWSLPTIKRILLGLEQMQLVVSERFEEQERNQRKWYTINYEVLRLIEQMPDDLWKQKRDERIKLIQSQLEEINLIQSEEINLIQSSRSKRSIDPYTEITPKTTTEISLSPLPPVVTPLELEEREDLTSDKTSVRTTNQLAALSDKCEQAGKEKDLGCNQSAAAQPDVFNSGFPEPSRSECAAAVVAITKSSSTPTPNYRDRTRIKFSRTAAKLDWELYPGVPYPALVKWRSQHYVNQGGHWADAANANAKSEIRNNPQRAADLWDQFLEYSNIAADSALAHTAAGMTPSLPSCFAQTSPVTKEQVMPKLVALAGVAPGAANQAVVTNSSTESLPYLANELLQVEPLKTSVAREQASSHACVASDERTLASDTPASSDEIQVTTDAWASGCTSFVHSSTHSPHSYELPSYQQQEQNLRKLRQMICSIKSMPKQHRKPEPLNQFEKMRSWLQGEDRILRNEATAWVHRCQDVCPVFDEEGNLYDFQKLEF